MLAVLNGDVEFWERGTDGEKADLKRLHEQVERRLVFMVESRKKFFGVLFHSKRKLFKVGTTSKLQF